MFRKKKLYSLLFFFLFLFAKAQQGEKTIPLKLILEEISAKSDVKFNYIEEELLIYQIVPPKSELPFEQKIGYIELKTGLKIKKISDKYYSVYNNSRLDKPLCGYLLDSDTELPIENAIIKISNTDVSVFSNEKGFFELPIVAPNLIEITHLSFEKKTINPIELYVSGCPKTG